MKKLSLIIFGSVLLTAFISEKPYVYLGGHKYYKCSTRVENYNDTLFEPGGFTIIKSQTKITVYDHFKCDGIDDDACQKCGKKK